jgi:hypothetical protein
VGLIRTLITVVVLATLGYCGATVELGNHTFFGHVARIWRSPETQEMVEGVKEKSGPTLDKVKRGVQKGLEEASRDHDAGPPEDEDGDGGVIPPS